MRRVSVTVHLHRIVSLLKFMPRAAINLKVLIIDPDFYAQRALNGYVGWDRRTRVTEMLETWEAARDYLREVPDIEHPGVILFTAEAASSADELIVACRALTHLAPEAVFIILAHTVKPDYLVAAAKANAVGCFLRNEVGEHIVSAILFARQHPMAISRGFAAAAASSNEPRLQTAKQLPKDREFPEMTERIRQALWLCVIEGMSAQLAADEMGVSPHTIRSYIKEGYRILKTNDDTQFPEDMSPEEQAFMRFTSLEPEDGRKPENATPTGEVKPKPRRTKRADKAGI